MRAPCRKGKLGPRRHGACGPGFPGRPGRAEGAAPGEPRTRRRYGTRGRAESGRARGPTASQGGRVPGGRRRAPRCTACDGRAASQAVGWHMRERAKPRGRRSGRGQTRRGWFTPGGPGDRRGAYPGQPPQIQRLFLGNKFLLFKISQKLLGLHTSLCLWSILDE